MNIGPPNYRSSGAPAFGFVLFNNDTEQMQYHHSSVNNNRVFDSPFQIRNRQDLDQVSAALENLDVFEWARQQTSKFQVGGDGHHQRDVLRYQTA